MVVSDSTSARPGRRRDAGFVAVGVAITSALVVGGTVAAVVLSGAAVDAPASERPSLERGRVVVERPFPDIQLPTL